MSRAHLATVIVFLLFIVPCSYGLARVASGAPTDAVAGPAGAQALQPVGPAFTYQGQLTDSAGAALAGTYDFEFGLYAEASAGTSLATAAVDDVEVRDGLFTLGVDFGPGQFQGEERWLEIAVRESSGSPPFTRLAPRQPLTAAPYALALPGLYTVPNTQSPNIVGGHTANVVGATAVGVVVAGGGAEGTAQFAGGNYSVIGGGANNNALGEYATVGGGYRNTARANSSTVSGGWDNEAGSYGGAIAGGSNNRAGGDRAAIGGGYSNAASGALAAIGGGEHNRAAARLAAIGGGSRISVTGELAAVGGGENITVTGRAATVGGGMSNKVAPPDHGNWGSTAATIGGGASNLAGNAHATVGGGGNNSALGYGSVVAGGGGFEHYGSLLPLWPVAGNTAGGAWSTVGGGGKNIAQAYASTIGGGFANETLGEYATIGGGGPEPSEIADPAGPNRSVDAYCTIGGGAGNYAGGTETFPMDGSFATVGGGRQNQATWRGATVAGGEGNTAGGNHATVPGGLGNQANAAQAFAAGTSARAEHFGSFVWADAHEQDFASAAENEVAMRATGGVRLVLAVDGAGNPTWACSVAAGGSWACSSDRDLKTDLAPIDGREVLERLDGLTLYTWSAKAGDPSVRHLGPTAQDFHATFGLGPDDTSISTIDLDGVALAAIQGLSGIVREQNRRIDALEGDIATLEDRLTALEEGSRPAPVRAPWGAGAGSLIGGLVLGLALLGRGGAGRLSRSDRR